MQEVNSKKIGDGDDDYEYERTTKVPSKKDLCKSKIKHDERGVSLGEGGES